MKKNLIVLLLFFTACSSQNNGSRPPVTVTAAEVVQKDVPVVVPAIGNVSATQFIEVRTQVTGQILEANIKEGQWIKKGDLLFTIDPSLYLASLNKAKGTLAKDESLLQLSKTKLARNAELVKKEFISPAVYDELKSNVEAQEGQVAVDKAEVHTAQINLDRTKIYAFAEGKISKFNFDPGNIVSPTDVNPLTTIQSINEVYIDFSLPENKFDKISSAQQKNPLSFDVYLGENNKIGSGKVVFIDNKIAADTGTFLLKGLAANPNKLMWPGQFVRITLILSEIKGALLIPETAVQISQKGPIVWIIGDDLKVKSASVTLSEKVGGWVVVTSGVKKGDKVVTLGQTNLVEGAPVIIKDTKS